MNELFDSVNSDLAINVVNSHSLPEDERVISAKCVEENIKILEDYIIMQQIMLDELISSKG